MGQFDINTFFFLLLFIWECFILPSFKNICFFQRFLNSFYVIKKIVGADKIENQKDKVILWNDEISTYFLFSF